MKNFLKFGVVALSAVFALGLGRLLASKTIPMIPAIGKLSTRVQEWLFDLIALATAVLGGVLGTKLAHRFLGGKEVGVKLEK